MAASTEEAQKSVFSKQASHVILRQVTKGPHLEKHLARSAADTPLVSSTSCR